MEIWEELNKTQNELNQALQTFRYNGIKYCEAERVYKVARSKEILKLRQEGMPTTLIDSVVKGIEHIAQLEFERNSCEVVYKANQEAINVKKLELRIIEEAIQREYGNTN